MKNRIDALFEQIKAHYICITSPENLRYYSGFTGGEASLILTKDQALLFTDSRYLIQAKSEAPDFEIVDIRQTSVSQYLIDLGCKTLGFEGDFVTANEKARLEEALPEAVFLDISAQILGNRAIKDETELNLTRKAAMLADRAFAHVLPMIKPGISELDVALELEWYMRKNGASGPSFDIICASGVRSAMPHGTASPKLLEKGDFVTLDFGCFYEGYASDMTRTLVLGKATEEQKKIYNTVLHAQEQGLQAICEGAICRDVDGCARHIIEDAGYGKCFGHSLGHGTGLVIHESPSLSPRSQGILKAGMTVTVEPGIYVENLGGVRIEDLVIVTESGYENLTTTDKKLLEL